MLLISTFAVFWGFPEVGLLAEMVGIGQVPHLAQGGYHAHYSRPYPQAVVPETTPQPVPCISTPTGSKSSCVSAADRSDSRPTAQTGPYYLDPVEPAFTHPTHHRFVLLALAAILTLRGRTIANLLRCLGSLAPGHPAVITASSPATAGPLGRWHVVLPRRSSPGLYPRAPSNWLATTPSRSTRQERLRQGLPSRPGPFHSLLHRLPLGAQVGRLDRACPGPLFHSVDGRCLC